MDIRNNFTKNVSIKLRICDLRVDIKYPLDKPLLRN